MKSQSSCIYNQPMKPLHEKLTAEFITRIRDGVWPAGEPIPSEEQLCEDFGVSRGPVRQALAQLRSEGLILGGRGRRPRVTGEAYHQPANVFISFSAWALGAGLVPGQRTVRISRHAAGEELADRLGIETMDPVVTLLRIRSLDGEVVMLERSAWIDEVGRHLLTTDTDAGSTYVHLTALGVDLFAATHVFDAVAADETDAEHLPVSLGEPLLRERRTTMNSEGRTLEFSDDRYLPERANFVVHNRRSDHGHLRLVDPTQTT